MKISFDKIIILIFQFIIFYLIFSTCVWLMGKQMTARAESPSGAYFVFLEDRFIGMDRNFKVYLKDNISKKQQLIFASPDEGRPIGTERFYWTADSGCFLLVGKEFFIEEEDKIPLPTGEIAYLLYDISTNECWCAASQRSRSGKPAFLTRDILDRVTRAHGELILR